MLDQGDTAPDFTLTNDAGEPVTLGELLSGNPLILYFYPADFTPLCTAEACSIRDMYEDIASAGIRVVGVSPQGEGSHQRFRERFSLPFPLLYDRGKKVIRSFGVDGPFGIGVRRATFLIDADRRIRKRVVSDLFVGSHTAFIRQIVDERS